MEIFDASGKKRLRESNVGHATDQLRSAAAQGLSVDMNNYKELLAHVEKAAAHIASESGMEEEPSIKKRLARIEKIVSDATGAVAMLEARVATTEESYRRLRYALLSEVNKMVINVPPMRSESHRVALTPSDMGEVRGRRNGSSTGAPKKSQKKKATSADPSASTVKRGRKRGATPAVVAKKAPIPAKKQATLGAKKKKKEAGSAKTMMLLPLASVKKEAIVPPAATVVKREQGV